MLGVLRVLVSADAGGAVTPSRRVPSTVTASILFSNSLYEAMTEQGEVEQHDRMVLPLAQVGDWLRLDHAYGIQMNSEWQGGRDRGFRGLT